MKSKCTTVLMGGLGNLMFQIAHAYIYSLKFNKEFELYTNLLQKAHHTNIDIYKDNIFKKLNLQHHNDGNNYFSSFTMTREKGFGYQPSQYIINNVLFHGYYQSYRYLDEYKKELIDLFNLNIHTVSNTCAIHVRRGDYAQLADYHPLQSLEYYKQAIDHIGQENKFHVFSDDINWCKDNFRPFNLDFIYHENSTPDQDFLSMLNCEKHIIANSTFSWWPAWLVNHKVVAPINWFGRAYSSYNVQDNLLLPEWKQI